MCAVLFLSYLLAIYLFSLYVSFSRCRPLLVPQRTLSVKYRAVRAYACISYWKTKGKFPWKHHVVWNGKIKPTNWKGPLQLSKPFVAGVWMGREMGFWKREKHEGCILIVEPYLSFVCLRLKQLWPYNWLEKMLRSFLLVKDLNWPTNAILIHVC